MKVVCQKNQCNGCMACVDICPRKAITVIDSIEYFNAQIDISRCINCGLCYDVCPNRSMPDLISPLKWYQGWTMSDKNRKISSSGGIASELIEHFIKKGGYVCSCVFEKGEFIFKITNKLEERGQFSGSKYVKSNPKGIYPNILNLLKNNKKVLFIGLPCQSAGLVNFISDQLQENLYRVDLICHGTPSQKILKLYLEQIKYKIETISDLTFRVKGSFGLIVDKKRKLAAQDAYTIAFLDGLDYTRNCYNCLFAQKKRVSDITIGDSWGTEFRSELHKGVSLILCQTEKGELLLKDTNLCLRNVDVDHAVANNHQLMHPSIRTQKVDLFFHYLKSGMSVRKTILLIEPKRILKQCVKKIFIELGIIREKDG